MIIMISVLPSWRLRLRPTGCFCSFKHFQAKWPCLGFYQILSFHLGSPFQDISGYFRAFLSFFFQQFSISPAQQHKVAQVQLQIFRLEHCGALELTGSETDGNGHWKWCKILELCHARLTRSHWKSVGAVGLILFSSSLAVTLTSPCTAKWRCCASAVCRPSCTTAWVSPARALNGLVGRNPAEYGKDFCQLSSSLLSKGTP